MSKVSRGSCPACFTTVKLRDDLCLPHRRNYATGSGCAGEGQVAKDELTSRQEQLVNLIEATIRTANTSGMSAVNSRRVALAVFWGLYDQDRWMLIPR